MRETNFFDTASPYLTHPLLTPERSVAEVELICSLISSTERVLDVGCGFGRHSVAFAQRGSQVVGIDPSPTMIAAAEQSAADAGIEAAFHCQNAAGFRTDTPFDLAICLFTTLGQLASVDAHGDPGEDLEAMFAALRPDGHVVIEVPERERAVASLVEAEELGPTSVTRSFDPSRSVISERFEAPGGVFDLAYRVFSEEELVAAVTGAGFRVEEVQHQALAPPPPTFMTLFAHRPH